LSKRRGLGFEIIDLLKSAAGKEDLDRLKKFIDEASEEKIEL